MLRGRTWEWVGVGTSYLAWSVKGSRQLSRGRKWPEYRSEQPGGCCVARRASPVDSRQQSGAAAHQRRDRAYWAWPHANRATKLSPTSAATQDGSGGAVSTQTGGKGRLAVEQGVQNDGRWQGRSGRITYRQRSKVEMFEEIRSRGADGVQLSSHRLWRGGGT